MIKSVIPIFIKSRLLFVDFNCFSTLIIQIISFFFFRFKHKKCTRAEKEITNARIVNFIALAVAGGLNTRAGPFNHSFFFFVYGDNLIFVN